MKRFSPESFDEDGAREISLPTELLGGRLPTSFPRKREPRNTASHLHCSSKRNSTVPMMAFGDGFISVNLQNDWVPAFAGTTEEREMRLKENDDDSKTRAGYLPV